MPSGSSAGTPVSSWRTWPTARREVEPLQVAVPPDEEDVQARQQPGQILTPAAVLDDVLDDQVVARRGQGGQAPVKPGEEPGADLLLPCERAVLIAPAGQHPAGHQIVR